MDRSYQEYFDIFMVLREYRKNYCQTANKYVECYLTRERKSHMAFKRLLERFIAFYLYGIMKVKKRRTRRKTATDENNKLICCYSIESYD